VGPFLLRRAADQDLWEERGREAQEIKKKAEKHKDNEHIRDLFTASPP
jgi:hypothetical protein